MGGDTVPLARRLGIAAEQLLARNDSCTFFQRLNAEGGTHCHLITGPNVMDIQAMLLQRA